MIKLIEGMQHGKPLKKYKNYAGFTGDELVEITKSNSCSKLW